MSWPFLYFPGDRLTGTELAAARLDGDLVEIGDAFMPADAVETPELRAASLRPLIPPATALIGPSAAWVHGATAHPPGRHCVQRISRLRINHVIDIRLTYRDHLLDIAETDTIGGLAVTTPERTLVDLARDLAAGHESVRTALEGLVQARPGLAAAAADLLARAGALHFKRPALAYLRGRAQEEVTRYTS